MRVVCVKYVSWLIDVHVFECEIVGSNGECKQETVHNGLGAVKGISEDLDQGTDGWRMDYGRLAL